MNTVRHWHTDTTKWLDCNYFQLEQCFFLPLIVRFHKGNGMTFKKNLENGGWGKSKLRSHQITFGADPDKKFEIYKISYATASHRWVKSFGYNDKNYFTKVTWKRPESSNILNLESVHYVCVVRVEKVADGCFISETLFKSTFCNDLTEGVQSYAEQERWDNNQ